MRPEPSYSAGQRSTRVHAGFLFGPTGRVDNDRMVRFTATVQLRGANPFVDVPTTAAAELLPLAEHGRIRVIGTLRAPSSTPR